MDPLFAAWRHRDARDRLASLRRRASLDADLYAAQGASLFAAGHDEAAVASYVKASRARVRCRLLGRWRDHHARLAAELDAAVGRARDRQARSLLRAVLHDALEWGDARDLPAIGAALRLGLY